VDELNREFLIESLEALDRMERSLTELEESPRDRELLAHIFRSVHTIAIVEVTGDPGSM
jgi:two-component system chemotaxis sensor kinase CheA